MKQLAKRISEAVLAQVAGHPVRMAGKSLILAYHNIVPDGTPPQGDVSLHLPLTAFRAQLDLLQRYCDVRPLDEVLSGEARSARPTVALTFDDAYRGAVSLGLPEVARRGLSATLFVAPALLGARSFWWDDLAPPGRAVPPDLRRQALQDWGGKAATVQKMAGGVRDHPRLPAWFGCASEAEIIALSSFRGIRFGAHSWDHPNLALLSGTALESQLREPLAWIHERRLPSTDAFAYPYGLRSEAIEPLVEAAGYAWGLLVNGGHFSAPSAHRWRVPRLNIPSGVSDHGFLLRLAGFFLTRGEEME